MKKLIAVILASIMVLTLCACGSAPTEAPKGSETPEATEGPTVNGTGAGAYHFEYVDEYGDTTKFSIKLREDGTFTVMTSVGPLGDNICSGTEWTVNADGTITTGACDNALELDFVAPDGSITWTAPDADGNVSPVGYTEPTEFLEKPVEAEAEEIYIPGVYKYTESGLAPFDTYYTIIFYDDGTYLLTVENERQGLVEYPGLSYTIEGTTVRVGPYEGTPDLFMWNDPAGFDIVTGHTTFVPAGETLGEEPEEAVTYVPPMSTGIYTFVESGLAPFSTYYTITLNEDGTYLLTVENERQGLVEYPGSQYTVDGVNLILGPYEGTPDLFMWNDPAGFTVVTGKTTFAPDGWELNEEACEALPAGIPLE